MVNSLILLNLAGGESVDDLRMLELEVDVATEFKRAVGDVPESDWHELRQSVGPYQVDTGQQWAEVNFVPNWVDYKKGSPEYRFIAARKPLRKPPPAGHGQSPGPVRPLHGDAWARVVQSDRSGDQP